MVPLLHHNVGDLKLIVHLHLPAGGPDDHQLPCHDNGELAFTDTVSEHYLCLWLLLGDLVELLKEFIDNILQVLDELLILATVLHSDLHLILCDGWGSMQQYLASGPTKFSIRFYTEVCYA